MITLKKDEILFIHQMIIKETGGSHGVRDEGLLDSAIYMPYMTFDGADLYPLLEDKASRLCFGLVKNHPFIDGNKRIGAIAMRAFLCANGVEVHYSQSELIDCILSLAKGELSAEELTAWIIAHIAEE